MLAAVDEVLAETGAGERAAAAGAQQGRPARRRAPPRALVPLPAGGPGVRRDGEGPRRAARRDRGALPRHAAADGAAGALRRGRHASPSCTSWPASSSARTPPRACASRRACRPRPPRASSASRRTATARWSDAALHAPQRGRAAPRSAHDDDAGSTCTPPRRRARPGRARRASAPASPSRSRRPRRPGAAALRPRGASRHLGRQRARPDRLRLPRRAARAAAEHRPRREPSRSSRATGSRSSCVRFERRPARGGGAGERCW